MKNQQILNSLFELEKALKDCNLWQQTPPSVEKLQSEIPFCADCLTIYEWLQWLFIPKIKELLNTKSNLPHQLKILPYLEIVIENHKIFDTLKKPLIKLENLLSQGVNNEKS